MTIVTLRDYAKQKNVTYEAVRKQVVRYASELEGHIIKDGRQQFLDEEAVAFLDSKRLKNPVVMYQKNKDEEIEDLRQEKENLLIKVAELSNWKAENAVAIAEASQNRLLLENKEKEIKFLEAQNGDLSAEIKKRDEILEEERKASQKLSDELTAIQNKWWYKLFAKKKGE